MQNRYAGDVGDFGKFALLRALFRAPQYKIGVNWYLFPDESHNADGKHTTYLNDFEYLNCDSHLCELLSSVASGNRTVAGLESLNLLPSNTVYFSEVLNFHIRYPAQNKGDRVKRELERKAWLQNAKSTLAGCNVVFLDPDNGLEVSSCAKLSQKKAGKYIYYHEIKVLSEGKDTCIVYHHLNRHKNHGSHMNQIQHRTSELREIINPTGKIFALRFKPYSPRAYFILTNSSLEVAIEEEIDGFMKSEYGKHWDTYHEG
ncbi:hypothetical protein HGB07_01340 [Candidatus Roizmanbacteria bacterium]|nr:hypothetical protein [Candidatus Roizmanbacteria bacterium]